MKTTSILLLLITCQANLLFGQIPSAGLVASWQFNGNFEEEGPNHIYSYPLHVKLGTDRFGQPNHAMLFDNLYACLVVPDHPVLHVQYQKNA